MAEPESDEAILQLVERLEEVGAGSLRYQLQMAASKIERLEVDVRIIDPVEVSDG